MKKRRKATTCFNCEKVLLDNENFCPKCGQENNSKQASIKQLSNDFMGDYISFDSRLFSSIVPLVFHPGKVTNEYLDGKRQRFIPPIRVFLFLSFLYFGLSLLLDYDSNVIQVSNTNSDKIMHKVALAFERNFNIIVLLYIPVFAMLVRLLFKSKEKNFFVNFFVYALHLFSFFFIIGIAQVLLFSLFDLVFPESISSITSSIVKIVSIIYILIYSIVSLKRVFNKKYTVLRFIAVLILSLIAFLILLLLAIFVLYLMTK